MIVKEIRPGFEKEVELLLQKKELLETEKKEAISEALKKVDEQFAEREETIISILKLITVEVEVEVEDPVEEGQEPESTEETTPVEEVNPGHTGEAISPSSIRFN